MREENSTASLIDKRSLLKLTISKRTITFYRRWINTKRGTIRTLQLIVCQITGSKKINHLIYRRQKEGRDEQDMNCTRNIDRYVKLAHRQKQK